MQLHQLKPKHKPKKKKRIGRGGKRGTYSGRGIKGQRARAGAKFQPMIREVIKRYPKLRGYRQKVREKIQATVNISTLGEKFKSGEKVIPKILIERKIVSKIKGRVPEVKILGKGELNKKLIIEDCKVSKGAREKIEKAGGEVKGQPKEERGRENRRFSRVGKQGGHRPTVRNRGFLKSEPEARRAPAEGRKRASD